MKNSFTLVELLIVIAVFAVLSTAVIIALNPFEFAKQARDARRLSELQTINTSLGVYQTGGGIYLGSSTAVYVSIPDSSATCANLGLPTLPSGWGYQCASSSTYRNNNGLGWIPVDFTSGSYGPGLEKLPIDPINTTSSGNYYTYVPGGSWELNAILESAKYRFDTRITKANLPGVLAVGNDLTRSPIYNTAGLVGYWRMDESSWSGTSGEVSDSSGQRNNGTASGGATTVPGLVNQAGSFDGDDGYVGLTSGASLDITDKLTIVAWVKPDSSFNSYATIVTHADYQSSWVPYHLAITGDRKIEVLLANSGHTAISQYRSNASIINLNSWSLIAFTFNNNNDDVVFYLNGGVAPATDVYSYSFSTLGTPWGDAYIGREYSGWAWRSPFKGLIDEARIYNRALSAAEIAAIYNATK